MGLECFYMNRNTGEVTESKDEAKAWYHKGVAVDIMCYTEQSGWVKIASWES